MKTFLVLLTLLLLLGFLTSKTEARGPIIVIVGKAALIIIGRDKGNGTDWRPFQKLRAGLNRTIAAPTALLPARSAVGQALHLPQEPPQQPVLQARPQLAAQSVVRSKVESQQASLSTAGGPPPATAIAPHDTPVLQPTDQADTEGVAVPALIPPEQLGSRAMDLHRLNSPTVDQAESFVTRDAVSSLTLGSDD